MTAADVDLETQIADGSRRTIPLHWLTAPDGAQKILLNRLGLMSPQRLRRSERVARKQSRFLPQNGPGAITRAVHAPWPFSLGQRLAS